MSDAGKWRKVDEHTIRPEAADKAQDALLKLKEIVEGMIQTEQNNLAALREQLYRVKHGGGA
jgi:hypothetical protein